MPRRLLACGLMAATLLLSIAGLAQQNPADRAVAESLFEEGRKLIQGGRYAEACPKFEESQRLDPGVGTLLYLGACYEKLGRTASAWITFREATAAARAGNQPEREKVAAGLAAALEPRLSRLMLVVPPESDVPGLQIKRDGTPFGRPLWGSAVPIDLGKHTIEVSAPSRKPLSLTADAAQTGQTVTVRIPPLEPLEGPAATSSTAPPAASSAAPPPLLLSTDTTPPAATARRTLALVAGGVGVLGLGLGGYFGLHASSQWGKSRPLCPRDQCDREGYDLATSASRSGNLSTLFFVVGAVGVGAGVTLLLLSPSTTAASGASKPSLALGASGSGLFARGTW